MSWTTNCARTASKLPLGERVERSLPAFDACGIDQPGGELGAVASDVTIVGLSDGHPGLIARMVDPMAPNLAALRRVSSDIECA